MWATALLHNGEGLAYLTGPLKISEEQNRVCQIAHIDGRFGVPVDISLKPVTLSAMPFARLRPVTHRTTDGVAYQADRFGLLLVLTASFDL